MFNRNGTPGRTLQATYTDPAEKSSPDTIILLHLVLDALEHSKPASA